MISMVELTDLAKEALKEAESTTVRRSYVESKYRYDDGYALAERLVSSKALQRL